MITYDHVKTVMSSPPTKDLIDLYNKINKVISEHPDCVTDDNPTELLQQQASFCISATSIQSQYVAFVLGKNKKAKFPTAVMHVLYNIDTDFKLQFGKISGKQIDGCICLIHKENRDFDLQKAYDYIYR
ncbi:MAG: hypothetical protein AB8G15_15490 [Saprospiraceae bacterium]